MRVEHLAEDRLQEGDRVSRDRPDLTCLQNASETLAALTGTRIATDAGAERRMPTGSLVNGSGGGWYILIAETRPTEILVDVEVQ